MLLQERPGGGRLAELMEGQRVQKMRSRCLRPLGEPVEKRERPLGPPVEQRRGGGHQEKRDVRRAGGNRLFRERQHAHADVRVRECREQPIRPDVGRIQRLLEQVRLAQC
jgi:hypothetical protein